MAFTKRPVRKAPARRRAVKKTSVVKKVATLVKAVKKLNTISYDKVALKMGATGLVNMSAPYYCYNITNGLNTWSPTWGTDASDLADVSKIYVNSYKLDVRVVQGTEPDLTFYTAFVVSLKDQANDSQTWLNSSTGALVLSPDVHYATIQSNGRVLMNPKYFNIHHYKRFYMGGRAGDQSAPVHRDMSFTIVPKNKKIENPGGNIFGAVSGRNGLEFPRDPSQNYFLVMFNDNSALDFENNNIIIGGIANVAIPS